MALFAPKSSPRASAELVEGQVSGHTVLHDFFQEKKVFTMNKRLSIDIVSDVV